MKSVLLPLGTPISSCYLGDAHPLSIMANSDDYLEWFFTNYLGICCHLDFFKPREKHDHYLRRPGQIKQYILNNSNIRFDIMYSNVIRYNGNCVEFFGLHQALASPYLKYELLLHSAVANLDMDILNLIKGHLDMSYYFYACADEYYLPYSRFYKTHHLFHDIFIYGYDDAQNVFFIQGYDKNRVFVSHTIKYNELVQAFYSKHFNQNVFYWTEPIYFLQHEKNTLFRFDHKKFIAQLRDYYCGSDISEQYASHCNAVANKVFGMRTYDILIDNIMSVRKCYADLRITKLLSEHKKIMKMRRPYLLSSGLYDSGAANRFCDTYAELEHEFKVMQSIIIKDIVREKFKNQEKVRDMLIDARRKEKMALEAFLGGLDSH